MEPPISRLIVVPVIRDDDGRVLLCKMPPDRGVFPGQWGLPGGGVEPGERIYDALVREVGEELGVSLLSATPLFFKDGIHEKTVPGEGRILLYMVFLLFECRVDAGQPIRLNDEFSEFTWAEPSRLGAFEARSDGLGCGSEFEVRLPSAPLLEGGAAPRR